MEFIAGIIFAGFLYFIYTKIEDKKSTRQTGTAGNAKRKDLKSDK